MALGVILAIGLGFLSFARVTPNGIAYRSNAVYQSTSKVLLTQGGRTFADPSRFAALTDLYSQLANSDEVYEQMLREGANKEWVFSAAPVPPVSNPEAVLPVIQLTGQAFSPAQAITETTLGERAFLKVVSDQPGAADMVVLQKPTHPTVVQPRKKTLLIVTVLGVLSATFGLALVLENMRPRSRPAPLVMNPAKHPPAPAPSTAASRAGS
jgi:hypothetical protein